MSEFIYHYCDAKEINTIATNLLHEFTKVDWTSDVLLTHLTKKLGDENGVLTTAIRIVHSGTNSKELQQADSALDNNFVCLKQFVSANTHSGNEMVSENASRVWKIIKSHDLNMHRVGYEKQLSLTHALIENLNEERVRPLVNSLVGVSELVNNLEVSIANFEASFRKQKEDGASVEETIAPSTQKKTVRNIINRELLPHLNNMMQIVPEKYEGILKVINEHIESVNTKARSRKTRSTDSREKTGTNEA